MALLRCSSALLIQLDAPKERGEPPQTAPGRLGDWCAMKFALGSRQAILFMNERTLLSFVWLEGRLVDAQMFGGCFWGGLAQILALEGWKEKAITSVVDSYSHLALTKVGNASLTAQMNSLVRDYRHLLRVSGGLKRCDVGELIMRLNHRPRKSLEFATPIEAVREALGTQGSAARDRGRI